MINFVNNVKYLENVCQYESLEGCRMRMLEQSDSDFSLLWAASQLNLRYSMERHKNASKGSVGPHKWHRVNGMGTYAPYVCSVCGAMNGDENDELCPNAIDYGLRDEFHIDNFKPISGTSETK